MKMLNVEVKWGKESSVFEQIYFRETVKSI